MGVKGGCVRRATSSDEYRRLAAYPIPRSRPERLLECERRLQENLRVEREANEAYEHYRAHGRDTQGRRLSCPPKPYEPPETPAGKINTTDLDSRNVKTPRSYTQGYNVQAAVNEHQIVLAAEVTLTSPGLRAARADDQGHQARATAGWCERGAWGRGRRQWLLA
jgi:hypothetical protein